MRPLILSDLLAAVRLLQGIPQSSWEPTLRCCLAQAQEADRFRLRTDRVHPLWGSGTLEGALRACGPLPALPSCQDKAFLLAMSFASHALTAWQPEPL